MGWSDVRAALAESDPQTKCLRVDRLWTAVASGRFVPVDRAREPGAADAGIEVPSVGRPDRPVLVQPSKLARRGLGSVEGRVALVHAVAHIEFNAINLALDAALRFTGMPDAFYRDWLSVAWDEARHFRMLEDRLQALGATYGDLPAHNGLWDMAEKTAHDVLVRMALVPRVLEARGLDVTPGMIDRLRAVEDSATVACLETILDEEVRHVAVGSRWFRFCCEGRGVEPEPTFRRLLKDYFGGALRGPFNHPARREAGFSAPELEALEAMA
ncbi:ferritin-like domain-containing protein [Halomonas denitrificans]|nr:ferritin-like domain-containing protein [Halomonas denitrificans]